MTTSRGAICTDIAVDEFGTASTVSDAVALFTNGAEFGAGLTDVLSRHSSAGPVTVASLSQIKELDSIEQNADEVALGSTATLDSVGIALRRADVSSLAGFVEAVDVVGSPQIRAMSTIGGNLFQHSRCEFARHGHGCGDTVEGSGSGTGTEDDPHRCRTHHVAGARRAFVAIEEAACLSPSASDLLPMLCALGASLEFAGADDRHAAHVPLAVIVAHVQAAGSNRLLAPEGSPLLRRVIVPTTCRWSTYRAAMPRQTFAFTTVSIAVSESADGHITAYAGGVSPLCISLPSLAHVMQSASGEGKLEPFEEAARADLSLDAHDPAASGGGTSRNAAYALRCLSRWAFAISRDRLRAS